jgi:competence protein ComEA
MFKKIVLSLVVTSSFLFSLSLSEVNEASDKKLGCIKGLGIKKLNNIINYKKSNELKSIDDLINVKGIGKVIIKNIKNDVMKKSCKRDKKRPISKTKNPRKKKRAMGAK